MRGRKPTPSALQVMRGNPGHRAPNKAEPKPELRAPSCPRELDKVARKEWRRMVRVLLSLGLLTEIDRAVLAGYCSSWSLWVRSLEALEKEGEIIKSPAGQLIRNPHRLNADRALNFMQRLAAEFGMSPSSRSRVTAVKVPTAPAETRDRFFGSRGKR